jgi:hypothetical protein
MYEMPTDEGSAPMIRDIFQEAVIVFALVSVIAAALIWGIT